jgi:hypothetical protein
MPIVSERGDLVGVVSIDDVIELLAEELTEVSKLIAREQRACKGRQPRRFKQIRFSDHSATSEGWHVQWETVPRG